jgi:thiol-disulfide isomerase/thioredoxin
MVVDPDGRGVPYLSIQIDLADPVHNGGAPVTAETDRNGYFLIRGLRPNQAYTLSAQAKQGGRVIAGQTVARPPSPTVRIQLREDVALPAAGRGADLPPDAVGKSPAPPAAGIPGGVPSLFDAPATGKPTPSPAPVPRSRDNGALPYPAENAPSDGAYSPVPPATGKSPAAPAPKPPAAPRSELVAPGPYPDKPPPASIPGPGTTPDGLIPPPALPPRTSAPRPSPGPFSLTDPLGRPRAFPSGRAGVLVLLDFMTTTCAPCRKAVPALTALQAKYGSAGLEVVGVACDDASESARRSLAAKYADGHRLNYLVYAEPGSAPGRVMKHFGVTGFPTLVLIDGTGSILWEGHPADLDDLERVVTGAARR